MSDSNDLFDDELVLDKMHEECGVAGVYNHPRASELVFLSLWALQHRGQESAGIAVANEGVLKVHRGMGLVNQVFKQSDILKMLEGPVAIGHNRYSTTGGSTIANAQPILIDFKAGQLAASHNGNLVNADQLRRDMEDDGSIFTSTTDTEVIMHLVARSRRRKIEDMLLEALSYISGAYSLLFLTKDAMYAGRDPRGVRPLLLGKIDEGYIVASETCAFDLIGATKIREIEPGEMIRIQNNEITTYTIPHFGTRPKPAHCVFEFIYFSRPDSFVFGENVDKIRRKLGRQLAKEHPVPNADRVIGVPDSATTAALGYAEESGTPFDIGLIRNHYIGRTFILPAQSRRDIGVRIKFNPVKGVLKGKRIVLVDDSIVRGTTMKKIVNLIKSAEPREIHLRISSPPIIAPCFYGIDMPTTKELIAHEQKVEEIRKYLEVDTIGYLSADGMLSVMPSAKDHYCKACFSGEYPITPPQKVESRSEKPLQENEYLIRG